MDTANIILGSIASLALAFGVGPILIKKFQSRKEDAETDEVQEKADSISVATAKEVVQLVKSQMLDQATDITDLKARVKHLEEESRLNLIWFSELNAWARTAHAKLIEVDPAFPPPPDPPWLDVLGTSLPKAGGK